MEHRLHLLESFPARGSDGEVYKVRAFEDLVRDETLVSHAGEAWEPTGRIVCRLEDGRTVEVARDGALRIAANGVGLSRL